MLLEVEHAVHHALGIVGVVGQCANRVARIKFDAFVALFKKVVQRNVVLARHHHGFVKRQRGFATNASVGGINTNVEELSELFGPLNSLRHP